jgi:hypothetical protein
MVLDRRTRREEHHHLNRGSQVQNDIKPVNCSRPSSVPLKQGHTSLAPFLVWNNFESSGLLTCAILYDIAGR